MSTSNPRLRNTSRALTVAAILLVVAGVGAVSMGLTSRKSSSSVPAQPASPTPRAARHQADPTPIAPVSTSGSLAANIGSTGSWLVIPALRVTAPLLPTGAVGPPGIASLTIPENIHQVGWWDGTVTYGAQALREQAPQPGQPGVAIIAGHVDSAASGPGALYHLKDLKPGDTIQIINLEGRTSAWIVSSQPEKAAKTALPASLFATTGPDRLALVSCGGPFDTATGHYTDNIIVWATPTPN
jgi:hypothetical protein